MEMPPKLPDFERPPLDEVALGVQFDPIEGFGSAHIGAFWNQSESRWTRAVEVAPAGQSQEIVGDAGHWTLPVLRLELHDRIDVRVQLTNESGDRMLQIENGWLVYNWRGARTNQPYPRYGVIRREFDGHLAALRRFLESMRLPAPRPNLWEVTYVNPIERGTNWNRPDDWPAIVPSLIGGPPSVAGGSWRSMQGRWTFDLSERPARLHVAVQHAVRQQPSGVEVLLLKLTARGPIRTAEDLELGDALDFGHRSVVRAFEGLTSTQARRQWGQVT